MPSTNWTLSDDETLAEYVPLEGFKGLSQNRIGISPDQVALLIRDGQIIDTYTGAHFAFGGVWQRIKELIGGQHTFRLLVASLKPFQIEGEIEGLSKDNVEIAGTVTVEFQVNPEKPANILGLVKERDSLTKPDIYERLMPHLRERVFGTILKKVDANEIRGNNALQDKIQADVLLEVERLFSDMGVLVRAVSLNWTLNDRERAEIHRSASERDQEMLDYQFERKKRELTREKEAREFVLRTDLDDEKLKAASEEELKLMILRQELNFIDARKEGVRGQELKQLGHELEVLNVQRRSSYKEALEDAQNEADRAAIRLKLTQIELEMEQMKQEQRLRLAKLEEEQNLEIAAKARLMQMQAMRDLSDIELAAKERERTIDRTDRVVDHEMTLKAKQLETQSEVDALSIKSKMTPDQLLALSAGLSSDVAKIFAERARVVGGDADKREALMREMLQLSKEGKSASEEQARYFFDKAIQNTGPGATRHEDAPRGTVRDAAQGATVECANCHKRPPSTDRFCRFCGQPLRT